jgi:hypothetical protein
VDLQREGKNARLFAIKIGLLTTHARVTHFNAEKQAMTSGGKCVHNSGEENVEHRRDAQLKKNGTSRVTWVELLR